MRRVVIIGVRVTPKGKGSPEIKFIAVLTKDLAEMVVVILRKTQFFDPQKNDFGKDCRKRKKTMLFLHFNPQKVEEFPFSKNHKKLHCEIFHRKLCTGGLRQITWCVSDIQTQTYVCIWKYVFLSVCECVFQCVCEYVWVYLCVLGYDFSLCVCLSVSTFHVLMCEGGLWFNCKYVQFNSIEFQFNPLGNGHDWRTSFPY